MEVDLIVNPIIQKRLTNACTTLVNGTEGGHLRMPATEWNLADGTTTTLRTEVEMEAAIRDGNIRFKPYCGDSFPCPLNRN